MTVMRIHKTKNFTVMSNHHFKEKKMSLKAKGLLSLMLSLPDDWNYSISGLVKLSKDGKDSVMTALAELEKFGYLTRVQLYNEKGQFNGIEYNIYEEPQTDSAVSEMPNSDTAKSDKKNAENPRQLNTNSIKNLKEFNINELSTKGRLEIAPEIYEYLMDAIEDHILRDLYLDYVLMRIEIDAPLTLRGLKMLVSRCERLGEYNINIQKAILETAIINNWQNVYAPKPEELMTRNTNAVAEEHKKIFFGE